MLERAAVAPGFRATRYCVTSLKVTVCAADMVIGEVGTVPTVATRVSGPPSMFQEATLCPVPPTRSQTPFDDTVGESPAFQKLSPVSEGIE